MAAPTPSPPVNEGQPKRPLRWVRRTIQAPVATCRVWLLLLTDYKRLFSEAMAGAWPYHVHPIVVSTLCFGLYSGSQFLHREPLGPLGNVGWFQVWDELDEAQQARALAALEVAPGDIRQMIRMEPFFPGASKASAQVKRVVGSVEAEQVATYLRAKDPEVGAVYTKKMDVAMRAARYESWVLKRAWGLIALLVLMIAIPLHLTLRSPERTFKQTLYVVLYLEAFVWPINAAVVTVSRFIPPDSWEAILLGGIELLLLVGLAYIWWRTLRFTHNATPLRLLLSMVAVAASVILVSVCFALGVRWLSQMQLPF